MRNTHCGTWTMVRKLKKKYWKMRHKHCGPGIWQGTEKREK